MNIYHIAKAGFQFCSSEQDFCHLRPWWLKDSSRWLKNWEKLQRIQFRQVFKCPTQGLAPPVYFIPMCIPFIQASEVLGSGQLGTLPTNSANFSFSFQISDINDNAPTFDQTSYTTSMIENLQDGSTLSSLIMQVTDRDSVSNLVVI